MPFPNFYPPAQVWLAALFHHLCLFPSVAAFKIAILIPVLQLPLVIWIASREITGRYALDPSGVVSVSLLLLTDPRFYLKFNSGIDLFSFFQLGLYAQSLGFVLLLLWLSIYLSGSHSRRRIGLSAIALALTILSNFFAAITAAIFVAAALLCDGWKCWCAYGSDEFRPAVKTLLCHLAVVLLGVLLALFWLVPMLSEYEYFVTRPNPVDLSRYISTVMWGYCVVALIGAVIWSRNPSPGMRPYLGGCGMLAMALFFSSAVAPEWFPLQAPRLLAILIFLLAVPAGYAISAVFHALARLLGEYPNHRETEPQRQGEGKTGRKKNGGNGLRLSVPMSLRLRLSVSLWLKRFIRAPRTMGVALVLLLVAGFTSPGTKIQYSFYTIEGFSEIARILDFAKGRRDGRYLVEVPKQHDTRAQFDGRAINAYLAAQGNETLSIAYHEASVNSLFFLPVVNAFSGAPYHFGISSVLGDDLDFIAQPVPKQLERARMIGTRYLVIHTPQIKFRLAQEPLIGLRHDFGTWSVFELNESPPPHARILPYRPALVVGDFTVKERRRNQSSFIRWAEEQFADGWFDVLLARAPERKIDRLPGFDDFGAIVLDTYDCDDCDSAFNRLREFARKRLLVALASDAPLFQRINATRSEFARLEIIDRQKEALGEHVNSSFPTYHYNSTRIRHEWATIRHALDQNKVPTFITQNASSALPEAVPVDVGKNTIELKVAVNETVGAVEPAPVLIANTFHPKWRREDGGMIYAATPFYMLTFTDKPVTLNFSRRWYDWVALWISAITFVGLACFTAWRGCKAKKKKISIE